MFDDLVALPIARFRMRTDDPNFHVQWRGGSRFLLTGEVELNPVAELDVGTPSGDFEVTLATHSTPQNAVTQLRRALPRDLMLTTQPADDGVEVRLQQMVVPAARPPRLRIVTSDLAQRVRQLEDNKVEFMGAVGGDGHLTILCDGRRSTLALGQGHSAAVTAARVAAAMPHGYRALVDGPMVSVWKDADFFEAVA